jgi:hypothetical protein
MLIARQRVAKHIVTEANARTNGRLLLGNGTVNRFRQQYTLFSVGSVQNGCKKVEFRS